MPKSISFILETYK